MKRYIPLAWLLVLALLLTSCIQVNVEQHNPQQPPSEPSTPTPEQDSFSEPADSPNTQPPAEPPTLPSYPLWSAGETPQAFLQTDGIVNTSRSEYSYEEMEDDLALLAAAYPARFSYRSFGKSVLGRELYVAVLGNPNAHKQILVSAGIHGREYLTPLLVMKQLEFYLAYYASGSCEGLSFDSLFGDVCFYVVPMTNPDGIMLSQAGIESVSDPLIQQKISSIHMADYNEGLTRQTRINEYLKSWKANANGVDLNRNYDALWADYEGIDRASHRNYKGTSPASEPETQAMVALTQQLSNPQAVLCIHSQGEVLYWNCGQEGELSPETHQFAQAVARMNGYYVVPEQNNDASLSDWCALKKDLIAITVETGNGVCPLPISQFSTIWNDNYNLLAKAALYFQS